MNEENERQLIQKETAVIKKDIKNLKMGSSSSSTVNSEACTRVGLGSGTFARPPLATRWADTWIPRKLEFKRWNPDFTNRNIQGISDSSKNRPGRSGGVDAAGSLNVV